MRVTSVEFDEDGDVSFVLIEVHTADELVYVSGAAGPDSLVFPVKLSLSPDTTAELFHRAGKVPGTHPDCDVATNVYYSLIAVVDRLIEYNI